jgi:Cu(I)/Ag(I) efflux system protein CusF
MKRVVACSLAVALSVFVVPFAGAQGMGGMEMKGDMKGMDMKAEKKGKSQTHKGSGTVSKVDSQKGTVTIAHGPVESMKWPSMTMTFKAKDKALLDKVKPGDKVDFSFSQSGKDYIVSEIK